MKVLVVVTVLVACGPTYYNFFKPYRLGSHSSDIEDADNNFFTPGGARIFDDGDVKDDEEQRENGRLSNATSQSPKYSFLNELIPAVAGDNSHYVEGLTRYVWMPDGQGVPRLVDLMETGGTAMEERSVSDTEYWLYTRRNPSIPQELNSLDPKSLFYSNFDPALPIIVPVHGWLSDGYDIFNTLMKNTFLDVQDVNVIVVDWRNLAKSGYGTAVHAVPEVGLHIAMFLSWLIAASGASWDNVHLIGFSLGAHIAGSAGRAAGGRPGRVTGLDPAGPLFHGNPENLSPRDGQYVEVLHTDGDRLGHFGSLGQVDFYVNGGRNPQPGCFLSTCSHSRVVDLFASSVRFNHFVGHRCRDITEAERASCRGDTMMMGNSLVGKRNKGPGIFGVKTKGVWPY